MLENMETGRLIRVRLGSMSAGDSKRRKIQNGHYRMVATTHEFYPKDPLLEERNRNRLGGYDVQEIVVGGSDSPPIGIVLRAGATARVLHGGLPEDEEGNPILVMVAPEDLPGGRVTAWLHQAYVDDNGEAVLTGLIPYTEYRTGKGIRFRTDGPGSVVVVSGGESD